MRGWRVALRIARRSVLRNRGRSALIVVLVGLPIAAATYVDVIARTFTSPDLTAQHMVGSADGAISITSQRSLQRYDPRWLADGGDEQATERDPAKVAFRALLPRGSRIAPMPRFQPVELSMGRDVVHTRILLGDVGQPLQRFLLQRAQGSRSPHAGEVLLTRSLARRLDLLDGDRLRPGSAITIVHGLTAPVAGLADDPSCLSCEQVVALPGSPIARAAAQRSPLAGYAYERQNGNTTPDPTYIVDFPVGTDLDDLGRDLARHGIALTTRSAIAHPVPGHGPGGAPGAGQLVALVSALGLLEVVLLAGAAFAVGARRQVRELGLVAATGGSARDVRRIVLAQGLVLSGTGAIAGIVAGALVAVAGLPLWERLANTRSAGWHFDIGEIAAAALVGMFSGVAAAVIPAIGASRMLPVDALAGRVRGRRRGSRVRALVGALLVFAGACAGVLANHQLGRDFDAYQRALPSAAITGRDLAPPSPGGPSELIVAAAVLVVIGVALLTPALIGWLAGIGASLPFSARLAVRDAERHRHRTGPATSAIMVAVAGSVALAFVLAGGFHATAVRDHPALPPHMLSIGPTDAATPLGVAARRAAAVLPNGRSHTLLMPFLPGKRPVLGLEDEAGLVLSVVRQDSSCPADIPAGICSPITIPPGGPLAIGGDDAVTRLVAGRVLRPAVLRALERGTVLVFDASMLDRRGRVHVATPSGLVRMPGLLIPTRQTYGQFPAGLVSAPTARAHGWKVGSGLVLVTFGPRASSDTIDAAMTAAEQAGATATRTTGPNKPVNLILAVLAAVAAFVTLTGVAVSVTLSVAEGRADAATLAAVGAQPGRRRALAASQALLVGGLGTALGAGVGTFIAFTAHRTTGSVRFVVPWAELAATTVAVPLLAAGVAAAVTHSNLPMVRRVE
jgi:putative ABC transport system permease protein